MKTPTRKIATRTISTGQFPPEKLPPKKIPNQDNSHPDNSHPENFYPGEFPPSWFPPLPDNCNPPNLTKFNSFDLIYDEGFKGLQLTSLEAFILSQAYITDNRLY